MINNLIFVAMVFLAVTEVIFVVAIIKMGTKLKELNRIYDFVHEIMKADSEMLDKINVGISEEAETYEKMYNLIDVIGEQYKTIISSHEQILEAYLIISNGYKEMKENHKTLLKCWKEIADNYDSSCEQFNLCVEELRSIKKMLEPSDYDADTIGHVQFENLKNSEENPFTTADYACMTCVYGNYSNTMGKYLCGFDKPCVDYDHWVARSDPFKDHFIE